VLLLVVWLAQNRTVPPQPDDGGGRPNTAVKPTGVHFNPGTANKGSDPPPTSAQGTVEQYPNRQLEHDRIVDYRVRTIEADGARLRCNMEIDYTYDKRHHPVSVVGATLHGENLRTISWDFWGDRGTETDEGAYKRGTRKVSMVLELSADEATSNEVQLFIGQGDPPDPVFLVRKEQYAQTFKRP
jgi:hypothetical protein